MYPGVAVAICAVVVAVACLRAASILHVRLLRSCLRSPMQFFETTPLGRVVNRFASDTDVVDVALPMTLQAWLMCAFNTLATLVVMGYSTPYVLIPAALLACLYIGVQVRWIDKRLS